MRYSVQLPTHRVDAPDEFLTATALGEMARSAEAAGFDACFVTDHPFPGDKWMAGGGHHALDPFVALSFAAAATSTIRLQTHILVAPYRNPFLTAKAAASLDRLSGGRLTLGLAAGYLKSEFLALGADFDARNEVTDEAIAWMRRAWTEDGVSGEGRRFEVRGNTMLPRPVQQPGPPIWVGGNSRLAIRRAVELGDGWVPFPNAAKFASYQRTAALETADDLAERIAWAKAHAEKVGRTAPLDVCFSPIGGTMIAQGELEAESVCEEAERLSGIGVTWLTLSVPDAAREAWCRAVESLGAGLS
jgi:probable F420-dependent oxidoreductase